MKLEEKEGSTEAALSPKQGNLKKIKKVITNCCHSDLSYYANGMCKNCYHLKGRTKTATKCDHKERKLYSKGVCKNCYLSVYHKNKRMEKRILK